MRAQRQARTQRAHYCKRPNGAIDFQRNIDEMNVKHVIENSHQFQKICGRSSSLTQSSGVLMCRVSCAELTSHRCWHYHPQLCTIHHGQSHRCDFVRFIWRVCVTCDHDIMFYPCSDLLHPCTPLSHPQHYLQTTFRGLTDVTSSTHVGGFWCTWHDIMISSCWVFWYPSTPINHPQHYLPNMFKCIIDVGMTTHACGFWHTGHDIMCSPRSIF